jgi:hypothetical protein
MVTHDPGTIKEEAGLNDAFEEKGQLPQHEAQNGRPFSRALVLDHTEQILLQTFLNFFCHVALRFRI